MTGLFCIMAQRVMGGAESLSQIRATNLSLIN